MYSKCFPAWGPYGKKYMGISRIADHSSLSGVRFDFTTVPSIFGYDIKVPNVTVPSACHPWRCAGDYSFITYRHDLDGKDNVYAEVSYVKLSDESTLIRTEIVNNTHLIQNCLVNFFESIEYRNASHCELTLPEGCLFKKALDYEEYTYSITRPWDEQNADGFKKGEFLDCRFTDGKGLGDRADKWHMPHRRLLPFGAEKGDKVSYKFTIDESIVNPTLAVRYRTVEFEGKNKSARFTVPCGKVLEFAPTDEPKIALFTMDSIPVGEIDVTLVSEGEGAVEFDFFCIVNEADAHKIATVQKNNGFMPTVNTQPHADGGFVTTCEYEHVDGVFTLRTFNNNTRFRSIETGALEDCMTARLSNSDPTFDDVLESFTGAFSRKHSDDGFFHNTIVHTLFVQPETSWVEYAVISKNETEYLPLCEYEKLYLAAKEKCGEITVNTEGEKYKLSNEILKATLLTNAVYPIYKYGEDIVHHTPGKRWDCLYTWDSGFIGLGMNEWCDTFADYSLDTYLSDESNPDFAFLHHGSPVPVQMYLYLEMLKRRNDKSKLLEMYPRAKLYYEFLAGRTHGSTTAKLKSGLTTTYDYFYSSSGMDDYPPQVAMMKQEIRDTTAPVISTSQLIRCGKILRMVATKLGLGEDAAVYEADCERLTAALNKYSWDEESGYFSYVLHDSYYNPIGFFTTDDGENLNKGLDGIYPLIAGVCNEEQKKAILGHLKSEKEMLCPYGISAVDMTAGYFMVNGYWNGNVWFPHQWFIWKTLLDLGDGEFAHKVAKLALDIWKREVDYSYYTFEMVSVVTGRGGWFHNFGGLSAPLNIWLNAYYKPGTLTTGLDTWVDRYEFSADNKSLEAHITCFGGGGTVLAVLDESVACNCKAYLDGEEVPVVEREKGCLEISISVKDNKVHTLRVQ